jgi:predicted ATPase
VAIELAASWTRVLEPTELLLQLQTRVGRLQTRVRDAPARHRTLWSAIAWSYDRLAASEQVLLRRLTVFAGSWTLPAMEAITEVPDALEILSALMDKSLVQYAAQPDAEPRYRMFETVRSFAVERLVKADELGASRARHADLPTS